MAIGHQKILMLPEYEQQQEQCHYVQVPKQPTRTFQY